MLFSYVSGPIAWQYLTASVQGFTDITADVKVAPPNNFQARWTSIPDCRIEATWDVSNHCNPLTSG